MHALLRTAAAVSFVLAPSIPAQTRIDIADPGGGWSVVRHRPTGSPTAIFGPGLRVHAGPVDRLELARRLADRTLQQHRDVLQLGRSSFTERIAAPVGPLYVFVYDQRFAGLRVIGGRADVRLHRVGVVSMIGALSVPIPADFDTKPAISARAACAIACDHLGLPVDNLSLPPAPGASAAELVVHADPYGPGPGLRPRLAWEVVVHDHARGKVGRVYVDARGASVLRFVDELLSCAHTRLTRPAPAPPASPGVAPPIPPSTAAVNLTGRVLVWATLGGDPTGPTSNVAMAGVRVAVAGDPGVYFTDRNGDFDIPHGGTAPVQVTIDQRGRRVGSVQALNGAPLVTRATVTPGVPATIQVGVRVPQELDRAQTDGYYHTDKVNEWLRTILASLPPQLDAMRVDANDTQAACNAFYGQFRMIFLAAGSFAGLTCHSAMFSDVIYHEWGHGLDDAFGGIVGNDGREGMSEAWGDILAVYLTDRPVQGLGFGAGISRSAINSIRYPAQGCSGSSPQCAAQSLIGFAWLLREGLAAVMPRPQAIRISERTVVAAVVANPATQPDAVREVFLLDDDDGNLRNGTPHYDQLAAAAAAKGIPFPARDPVLVQHTPLTDSDQPWAPHRVAATIQGLQSPVASVDVVYDLGVVPGTVPMVALPGAADRYAALIPGVTDNTTIRYHLQGRLQDNTPFREPAGSARHSFHVQRAAPFLFTYRATPEQVPVGTSTTIDLAGSGRAAMALLFGDRQGPIRLPGLPEIWVDGSIVAVAVALDAQGTLRTSLPVANRRFFVGRELFTHALGVHATGLQATNRMQFLFQ